MAKKRKFSSALQQPWLIIFSDLMTLMLTFFVILVSMSVVDENSRRRAVDSVRHVFGFVENKYLLERPEDAPGVARPGVSSRSDATEQAAAQLIDNDESDSSIRYTDTEIIVSLHGNMLFFEGGISLSAQGRNMLDKLLPALNALEYPLLIAGYSAPGMAEGAKSGFAGEQVVDSGWALSMERSLAVYKYFTERGIRSDMLRMEAHGSHRPAFSNNSSEGRRKNRRIDLVLARRNPGLRGAFESMRPIPGQNREFYFRDFRFNLDGPVDAWPRGGAGVVNGTEE